MAIRVIAVAFALIVLLYIVFLLHCVQKYVYTLQVELGFPCPRQWHLIDTVIFVVMVISVLNLDRLLVAQRRGRG